MFAVGVEPVEEPLQEAVAVIEQALEGDLLRDDAVVEEQDDRASRCKAAEVGPRGINAAGDLDPVLLADLAPPPSLRGRQDREVNAGLGQDFQRLMSTAVSASHIPSGSRPKRCRKSAMPQSTWVCLSLALARGR